MAFICQGEIRNRPEKDYLNYAKKRKNTAKTIRKAIKKAAVIRPQGLRSGREIPFRWICPSKERYQAADRDWQTV